LVEECCDPSGLASQREFSPTVAAIVEWCDRRLSFHQSVAAWKPRLEPPPEPPVTEEERQRVHVLLKQLAAWLRTPFDLRGPAPSRETAIGEGADA
jgi:hypothetical protein